MHSMLNQLAVPVSPLRPRLLWLLTVLPASPTSHCQRPSPRHCSWHTSRKKQQRHIESLLKTLTRKEVDTAASSRLVCKTVQLYLFECFPTAFVNVVNQVYSHQCTTVPWQCSGQGIFVEAVSIKVIPSEAVWHPVTQFLASFGDARWSNVHFLFIKFNSLLAFQECEI